MARADRYSRHRARVLTLLQERQAVGVTTPEISDPAVGGHEGPRRLRELRERGHKIQGQQLGTGYWRYWLLQPGETEQPQGELFE